MNLQYCSLCFMVYTDDAADCANPDCVGVHKWIPFEAPETMVARQELPPKTPEEAAEMADAMARLFPRAVALPQKEQCDLPERIAAAIEEDVSDRGHWWDDIDDEVKDEIRQEWRRLIREVLAEAVAPKPAAE